MALSDQRGVGRTLDMGHSGSACSLRHGAYARTAKGVRERSIHTQEADPRKGQATWSGTGGSGDG
eukprot:scaffold12296_cov27-Tisochrysis_lutea.AAC.6